MKTADDEKWNALVDVLVGIVDALDGINEGGKNHRKWLREDVEKMDEAYEKLRRMIKGPELKKPHI